MHLSKITGILTLFLVCSVLAAVLVSADSVPAVIDDVRINGDSLDPWDENKLAIERGEEIEVKVVINTYADSENVQVEAEIRGYEYSDYESTSDITRAFDAEANVTYSKKLKIMIPSNVEEDSYKLRVTVTNKYDDAVVQNYNLKIDAPRHSMYIRDILLTPGNEVEAGKILLAAVRVKNMGSKDEDSVKVTISIPELGLSASDYIDEVEEDDSETSEELYLRIPVCAEAGNYDVVVRVEYDEGHEEVSEATSIDVVESSACVVDDESDEEQEDEEEGDEEESEDSQEWYDDAGAATGDDSEDGAEDSAEDSDRTEMLRKVLEVSLIVLIIALVIIGLIVGFASLMKEEQQ